MSKNKTVLIVEDSHVQGVLAKRIFEENGYRVVVAFDGEQGIDAAARERPDLVVADIKMPRCDGFEMCRRIKEDPQLRHIPILMLTELWDTRDIIRALKAGADNYVTKPYSEEYLLHKSEVMLSSADCASGEQALAFEYHGEQHHIVASPCRILNLLLSTYESAVQKNRELLQAQEVLKSLNEKLEQMAFFDSLTGLGNRRLFFDRLEQHLRLVRRHAESFAILSLDLDHFKEINDTLGHDAGDSLLVQVAQRLKDMIRQSDTASRFGGDEFTLLLPKVQCVEDAAKVANKVIRAISQPYVILGEECRVGVSIGIAVYPDSGQDKETLLKSADEALYRAKSEGRNRFCIDDLCIPGECAARSPGPGAQDKGAP